MRRALFAAFLACCPLIPAAEKAGEREEKKLEVTATAGFGGATPLRAWIPLWVRIRAPKQGFEGTIEARAVTVVGPTLAPVRRPVEVAAESEAEYFVAVPFPPPEYRDSFGVPAQFSPVWIGLSEISVSLLDRKGRTQARASAPTKQTGFPAGGPTVVVQETPPAADPTAQDRPGAWARLPLRRFPLAWQALDGVDRLVLRAESPESEAAVARIRDWVLGGGTCAVIIPRGPVGIGPALQELMGADVGASFDAAPKDLGATAGPAGVVACELVPRPGTRIRTSIGERAVAVERLLGGGRVLAFGFDVEAIGAQDRIAPVPGPVGVDEPDSTDIDRLLASFRGFIALPLWLVATIFAAYILLIGPIEYVVLRAIGRTRWTWITLPVTAIAFFVLIHRITAYRRAGGIEGRAIGIAVVDPAAGRAVLRARTTIYSPLAFRAEIESPLRGAAVRVQPERSEWGNIASFLGQAIEPLDLDPKRGWILRDVVFRTSATRTFEIDWAGPAAEMIDLRLDGTGTLVNEGPVPIDEIWTAEGPFFRRLEGLPPGGRLDIEAAFRREDAPAPAPDPDPEGGETVQARFRARSRNLFLREGKWDAAGIRSLLASLGRIPQDSAELHAPGEMRGERALLALVHAGPELLRVDGESVPGEQAILIQVVLP